MQDVYSITRENVHLAVRSGTTALYIERIYGAASVKIVSRPGSHLPLRATGVGKVLLAYAPDDIRSDVPTFNERMVLSGWAVADRRLTDEYAAAEDEARKAKRGLWAGEFVRPAEWRDGKR